MPRPGLTVLILLGIVVSVLCELGGSTMDRDRIDWAPPASPELLVTAVPFSEASEESPRPCTAGSRLLRIAAGGTLTVLAPGFDAACDPVLAPDGERLIFRGRERSTDPWRIWELELESGGDGGPRAVTPADRGCLRPAILADGGAAFVCGGDLFRTPGETDSEGDAAPVRLTASGGSI
ncbi:MAG: hypothetical protein R3234_06820, partial [Thermoanaerobaculia bacterium]|nr:hypothetical protein [Thermoanaerobaculia bacterium]